MGVSTSAMDAYLAQNGYVSGNAVDPSTIPPWYFDANSAAARSAASGAMSGARSSGDQQAYEQAYQQYAAANGGSVPSYIQSTQQAYDPAYDQSFYPQGPTPAQNPAPSQPASTQQTGQNPSYSSYLQSPSQSVAGASGYNYGIQPLSANFSNPYGSTASNFTAGGYNVPSSPVPQGSNPQFPNWSTWNGGNPYTQGDPGMMATSEANRAVDYGNTFENQYANQYQQALGQESAYQGQADKAYSDLYANPGYSAQQTNDIMGQAGLQSAMTTPDQYQSNYLTSQEQGAIAGNPQSIQQAFDPYSVMAIPAGAYDTQVNNISNLKDQYGNIIDPSKLGISDQRVAELKDQAGRQVGLQYGAAQDQLQRGAEASGNVNPLALAASRDRLLRSSAVGQANAVTDADIAAGEAQRQANVGIANMQLGAATNIGNMGQNAAQWAGTTGLGAGEFAGTTAINQAQAVDALQSQRAQDIAQNRQSTNLNNQNQQFQQGFYTNNALSNRSQAVANQAIQGQQAARNYWQGQGQYQGSQANQASQARLSGAQTSLSGMGQGGQVAMGTEIGRRSTRPISIGTGGITVGL